MDRYRPGNSSVLLPVCGLDGLKQCWYRQGVRSCREELLAHIDQGLRFRRVADQDRARLIPPADDALTWIELAEAYPRHVHPGMEEIRQTVHAACRIIRDIDAVVPFPAFTSPGQKRNAVHCGCRCRFVSACEQAERVINELDELVETGFRGRQVARVDEMIEELSRMESDTDALEERVQRLLFGIEEDLGRGDVTTDSLLLEDTAAEARIVACPIWRMPRVRIR